MNIRIDIILYRIIWELVLYVCRYRKLVKIHMHVQRGFIIYKKELALKQILKGGTKDEKNAS